MWRVNAPPAQPPDVIGELQVLEVYLEYDGPRIFLARSTVGLFFVYQTDEEAEGEHLIERCLVVPFSEPLKERLVNQRITIREALLQPIFWVADFDARATERKALRAWTIRDANVLPSEILPDPHVALFGEPVLSTRAVGAGVTEARTPIEVVRRMAFGAEQFFKHVACSCSYDKPWQGSCGLPATGTPPRCAEHAGLACVSCGKPATRGCDDSMSLVCGAPLCSDCVHIPGGSHAQREQARAAEGGQTMSDTLMPCPFCGGKARWSHIRRGGLPTVVCSSCAIEKIEVYLDSESDRDHPCMWNRRATPQPTGEDAATIAEGRRLMTEAMAQYGDPFAGRAGLAFFGWCKEHLSALLDLALVNRRAEPATPALREAAERPDESLRPTIPPGFQPCPDCVTGCRTCGGVGYIDDNLPWPLDQHREHDAVESLVRSVLSAWAHGEIRSDLSGVRAMRERIAKSVQYWHKHLGAPAWNRRAAPTVASDAALDQLHELYVGDEFHDHTDDDVIAWCAAELHAAREVAFGNTGQCVALPHNAAEMRECLVPVAERDAALRQAQALREARVESLLAADAREDAPRGEWNLPDAMRRSASESCLGRTSPAASAKQKSTPCARSTDWNASEMATFRLEIALGIPAGLQGGPDAVAAALRRVADQLERRESEFAHNGEIGEFGAAIRDDNGVPVGSWRVTNE